MAQQSPLHADETLRLTRAWVAWSETVLVTAFLPILGFWIDKRDPFFLSASFPWVIIGPVLCGLRYGFAYGFGSALLTNAALAYAWRVGALHVDDYPAQFGVGLLIIGMLAGEFADMWIRRVRRLVVISGHRRTRLDEFARGYHLLKISHDALEQQAAGTAPNLRESIMTVRQQLTAHREETSPLFGLGQRILSLFADYGWVQLAAAFSVDEASKIDPSPAATLGEDVDIAADDPLIVDALRSKMLVSVQGEGRTVANSRLLAAIPLVDVHGRVWGVVAVRHMLFIAFHAENLKLLAVMGGHLADILAYGSGLLGEAKGKAGFLMPLERALSDVKRYRLSGSLVALVFKRSPTADVLMRQIVGQRRGLDQALVLKNVHGDSVVFVLLPLTGEIGLEGYLARLTRMIRERYGTSLEEAGVVPHQRVLTRRHTADDLFAELCRVCEIDESDPVPPGA